MQTLRDFLLNVRTFWVSLPVGVTKAVRDALLAGVAAFIALNLAIPSTLDQAKAEGLIAILAVAAAVLAVVRVELLPALISWILGVPTAQLRVH